MNGPPNESDRNQTKLSVAKVMTYISGQENDKTLKQCMGDVEGIAGKGHP